MKKLFKLLSESHKIFIDNEYISDGNFVITKNYKMPLWLQKVDNVKTKLFDQINVPFDKGFKVKFAKKYKEDSQGTMQAEFTDGVNTFYYNKKYIDIIIKSNDIFQDQCDFYFCGHLEGHPYLKIFYRDRFLGLIAALEQRSLK